MRMATLTSAVVRVTLPPPAARRQRVVAHHGHAVGTVGVDDQTLSEIMSIRGEAQRPVVRVQVRGQVGRCGGQVGPATGGARRRDLVEVLEDGRVEVLD